MRSKSEDVLVKPGPLDGIKVIEYAVFHAGPGAGAILGDMGADVIKVEASIGDPLRHWGRVGKASYMHESGKNPMFEFSNRNKRCIYLDIETEKGWKIFEKLIKEADVFLTNLRKTTKPKLKVDYDSIKEINPKIVYSSVSGYGKEGPVADTGAYDPLGQARSGMMYLADSEDPKMVQLAILDQATAITTSHAIMTALFTRERHGVGQEVHTSLFSTALWLTHANMFLANLGVSAADLVWDRTLNSPLRNSFRCKDDKWVVGTHHPVEKYWPILCSVMELDQLVEDPLFVDEPARSKNAPELVSRFDEIFMTKTREEWLEIFNKAGLMFSPIQKITDVPDDPQAIANNYVVDFEHPDFGTIQVPGYPVDFSTYSAGIRSAAPNIGEHTDAILKELNFTEDEIVEFRKEEIVK